MVVTLSSLVIVRTVRMTSCRLNVVVLLLELQDVFRVMMLELQVVFGVMMLELQDVLEL